MATLLKPRIHDNNTDGDAFDDGDEDANGNGIIDAGETDPTRREDSGDQDNDGIQNWEENLSCTEWNVADTDFGGINDGDERNVSHGTDPCDSLVNFVTTFISFSAANQLFLADASGFNPNGGIGYYNNSGTYTAFGYLSASVTSNALQGVSPAPTGTQPLLRAEMVPSVTPLTKMVQLERLEPIAMTITRTVMGTGWQIGKNCLVRMGGFPIRHLQILTVTA